MKYVLDWHIPNRVLVLNVSGDVSLDDLEHFNNDMNHYLEHGLLPIHLISIGDNIRRVPTNLMAIKQTVTFVHHSNMGWAIIVQEKANPVTGFMLTVAVQATGMKMCRAKNIHDGLVILSRLDSSIDQYASIA